MKVWPGTIVLAYKTSPLRILLVENKATGNITTVSGAVEEGETLKEAAVRELKEEVDWDINPESLCSTPITHNFIYAPQKKERAGDRGENQVFLLNANNLAEPKETSDTKSAKWVIPKEAKEAVTFKDLGEVIEKSSELLLIPQTLESKKG